jgi:uncharacterized protein DUF6923
MKTLRLRRLFSCAIPAFPYRRESAMNTRLESAGQLTIKRTSGLTLLLLAFLAPAGRAQENTFYSTAGAGAELFAIRVTGAVVSTTDIGPTGAPFCASLALAPGGTLYSVCGPLFGTQQLATIDPKTGHATLFGVGVPGLAVMALAFGPNGTLYAVGDCNPAPMTFECTPGSDPNYNSLYTVNVATGAFTRIGSTGAPQFFMDLAFDRTGNLFGVTTTLNPSVTPAILYRIDPQTGVATKVVGLVGSNYTMGLAFDQNNKLYANDFELNPGLYQIDMKTGFETAVAALPFPFLSGLELAVPLASQ